MEVQAGADVVIEKKLIRTNVDIPKDNLMTRSDNSAAVKNPEETQIHLVSP